MHIPDGYLSPSTCAVLYAATLPFECVALRRLRRLLHTRMIPLVAVFAAFSFVVMMFNLPLPGGTSGHAVGMAVAAIVLGPWGGMLAVSVALVIQAIFFGDGGVTALGANGFNMAVVGSLLAYGVYRLVSGRAPLTARRRVIAAGLAGYVAINAAALLAGVELGLQPLLFRDPGGTPLYAPYPLEISVPAMLVGHLTFAGLAELIVSAGVVAYLQRTDPLLLARTAPGAVERNAEPGGWRATRPLWLALALLLIATPLGLLAAGEAWGEWGPEAYRDPEMRAKIQAASQDMPPPEDPPAGLERLASVWTAPFPNYAPTFLKTPSFGYVLSAAFGVGVILLIALLLSGLRRARAPTGEGQRVGDEVSSIGH